MRGQGRHSVKEGETGLPLSCANCGDPRAVEDLTMQDGNWRCPGCLRRHGKQELDDIENASPSLERLGAKFGGRTTKNLIPGSMPNPR